MNYEDGEYYWILPKGSDDWEVGKCERVRRAGYLPDAFEFLCSISGTLSPENCQEIVKIERNYE